MKKILLFTSSLNYGGAENQVLKIFNALSVNNEVKIVIAKNSIISNPEIIQLSSNKTILSFFKFLRYANSFKPDVILSTLPVPNLIAAISKLFINKKTIIINREANFNDDKLLSRIIFRISSLFSDIHIFNSQSVMNFYSSKYPKIKHKFFKVNNIVSKTYRKASEPLDELTKNKASIKFLSVARLEHQKGVDILIEAFNQIRANSAELFILGEGSQYEQLKNLRTNKNIHFLGYKNNALDFINNCDIYVQPSRKEGMPNSLLEAILLNKICLVSNCIGGSEEVVQKYTDGLVFKSEDINDLAKKIEILLSRESLSTNTQSDFYIDFSEENFLKTISKLI